MSAFPTASAKISQPAALLIGRGALVDGIAAGGGPLTWIVAPAGSGKTCLALEFAQRNRGPVAWLRLDEADKDPASFTHYLELAIRSGGAAADWARPPLLNEHLMAPQGYMRIFIRSLAAALANDACVILDDAHLCQEAPFFVPFLDLLADELPPGVRVLVLSRAAVPEACARLLAHGRLREVGAAELSFSAEETGRLLSAQGLAQAGEVRDAVFQYTHGWAAGVTLVAFWLRRQPRAIDRLDGVGRVVSGYLAKEVFGSLDDTEREVLQAICWLPYFRTEWGDALSSAPQAIDVLARLAARGVLIYEYPGRQYSLHPLFQRFLRDWSTEHHGAARCREWIERGIDLLAQEDDVDSGIELALAHGLMARAARMIAASAQGMLAAARHQTLARWVGALPEAERSADHNYWLGMATYVRDTASARVALRKAYAAYTASGDQQHRFLALSMIIVSYSFNGVDSEPIKEVLASHLDAARDYEAVADPELRAYLTLAIYSGLVTCQPGHADFSLWEDRAVAALAEPISPEMKVRLATWLAIHCFFAGRYRKLSTVRALLDSQVNAEEVQSYQRYLVPFAVMFDELLRGDHAALEADYAKARQLADDTGFRNMDGHYALQFAGSRLLLGDPALAAGVAAKVAAATPAGYYNQLGHLHVVQAWIAAWRGDAAGTGEYARLARDAGRAFGGAAYEAWSRVADCIAAVLAASPEFADRLRALREIAEETGYVSARVHVDLLAAWALQRAGRGDEAVPPLRAGLALLRQESEGFLWCAVPQVLTPLCCLALERDVDADFARVLIRTYRLTPPADAPDGWPWRLEVRCFGHFELLLDGAPLPSRGKSKHRQLDLVKLLAAHAPRPLGQSFIAERLWPDSEGDAARHALDTTLSRLRSTLGRDAFVVEGGMVSMRPELWRIDTAALESLLDRLDAAVAEGEADVRHIADRAIQRYRGDLLSGDGSAWILPRRDYWRKRLARSIAAAAAHLADTGGDGDALRLLQRAFEVDPHAEAIAAALMRFCHATGRYADGLAAYRGFRRAAIADLGATVAQEIEGLARQLEAGN